MIKYYELTESQKTMFAAASRQNDTSYNLIECIEINDMIDISNFKLAFNSVINNVDSLKIRFITIDGQIFQYKNENEKFDFNVITSNDNNETNEIIHLFNTPFKNINETCLVKFLLIKQNNSKFYFVICAHHLIIDGISLKTLLYNLIDCYYGREISLSSTPIFELYKKKNARAKALNNESYNYWINELKNINMIKLPFNQSVNNEITNKADTLYYLIGPELRQKIKKNAKYNNVTIFEYMLTIFNIMLVKISGQNDIVVGVPLSGRNLKGTHKSIGMFVNTLPMRFNLNEKDKLGNVLKQTHKKMIKMSKYQDCSFEKVLNKLRIKKEKNRELLFDVLFSFYDERFSSIYPQITRKNLNNDSAQFFITMNVLLDNNNNILLKLEYFEDLFDKDIMKLFLDRYVTALRNSENQGEISKLEILSPKEKNLVTKNFNNTKLKYNYKESLVEKINKFSILTPDKVALIYKGKNITFSKLQNIKQSYINLLKENNVDAYQIVGVQANRSPQMVAAILAIWQIGAVYVPIDKVSPIERVNYIIKTTHMNFIFREKEAGTESLILESLTIKNNDIKERDTKIYHYNPNDLAYIIFTSGSTGVPKGAMITHLGMTNHLLSKKRLLNLDNNCIVMQNATHAFDISIWQFFSALSVGGTTVIATDEENRNIDSFLRLIIKEKIGILEVVPSYLQLIINHFKNNNMYCPELKNVLITGEKIYPNLARQWFLTQQSKYTRLINAYGPTEAADDITHYIIKSSDCSGDIPIGKPINNMRIYILNNNNAICGLGIEGEICVTGLGVGNGYIGNREKTKSVFVKNPYENNIMYRTGDLGFWRKDGSICYVGRKDDQVKIRGYRIELGEIQSRLESYPEIENSIVLKNNKNELVAYVSCLNKKDDLNNTELLSYLKNYLPNYMIPNYFVKLNEFPLSVNGKIDIKKLKQVKPKSIKKQITSPETETQKKLFNIWSTVLDTDNFGIDDLFIDLYGNSIKAIYMVDLIQEKFEIEIDVETVLNLDTIRKQAEYIDSIYSKKHNIKNQKSPKQKLTLVSPAQKRVFLSINLFKNSITYNMPALFLLNKPLEVNTLYSIFYKIIQNHPNLRTNFFLKKDKIYQFTHDKVEETNFTVKIAHEDELTQTEMVKKYTKPFNLEKDCLIRVILIKNKNDNYLFIDLSHMISDGISLQILIQEFCKLYNNQPIDKEILTYQDFLDESKVKNELYLQKRDYWLKKFKDAKEPIGVPYDKQPKEKTEDGTTERLILGKEYLNKLRKISKVYSVSLQVILLSIYYILLFKYTGQSDLTVGTVSIGRKKYAYRNTIGMFVNTLPLRLKLNKASSFTDLIQQVKKLLSQALDNEEYQYDTLLEDLKNKSNLNTLFSSLFIFQGNYTDSINVGSLNLKLVNHDQLTSKFDTEYQIFINNGKLILEISYLKCLYKNETIKQLLDNYKKLLNQIIIQKQFDIKKLSLLPIKKIDELKSRRRDYEINENRSLITLFKKNVTRFPNKVAVREGTQTISYLKLDIVSNNIALFLEKLFGKHIYSIGIEMDNSITMIATIIAVLKTGAMYIPIDKKLPSNRKLNMLQNGKAVCLLSDTKQSYGNIISKVINWRNFDNLESNHYNVPHIDGETGACIVYTSGTTGNPKGNVVKHKNIMRVVDNPNFVNISDKSVIMQSSNFSFDGSFFNIFGSICNGSTLVLCDMKRLLDLSYIKRFIRTNKITHFFVTTSLFNVWVENIVEALSDVDYILIGGESASVKHCKLLFKSSFSGTLINGYGPTESTFFATTYSMTKESDVVDPIPIGKPISKTNVYLINKNRELLPRGIEGEIAIGGSGLIREYINSPDLYNKRFIHLNDELVYLTGDRAIINEQNQFVFLGRIDNQIKHNGYRIELDEIEATLNKYHSIQQGIIIYDKNYDTILGFAIPNKEYKGMTKLKEYLSERLPFYMLPSKIEIMSSFPLNKNGKVDRKKLEESFNISRENESLNNKNKIDNNNALLRVAAKYLNQQIITEKDNFFERGGDSIKAIQISAELLKMGYDLQANDILVSSSFEELSKKMHKYNQIKANSYSGPVDLLPNHKRYLTMNTNVHHFLQSVLLETKNVIDRKSLKQAIETVLKNHDMLRSVYHDNKLFCKPQNELDYGFYEYDFSKENNKNAEKKIEESLLKIKSSINLEKGPVFLSAIFKTSNKEYLLLCCHHFMVDSISWRIILDDFFQQYYAKTGSVYNSLVRTSSFKEWVDNLNEYTKTELYKEKSEKWKKIDSIRTELIDKSKNLKKQKQLLKINKELSYSILNKANRAYTTEPYQLIVTALSESIFQWLKKDSPFKIIMESHGRESIFKKINISRTVGWFTTIYPFLVNKRFKDTGVMIKYIKEEMNSIPNKGLDYGLYKYSGEVNRNIKDNKKELVSFNFLGDLNVGFKSDKYSEFSLAKIPNIGDQGDEIGLLALIEISGMVINNQLIFEFTYENNNYSDKDIMLLKNIINKNISKVVSYCLNQKGIEKTPSDFSDPSLSKDDLEKINNIFN